MYLRFCWCCLVCCNMFLICCLFLSVNWFVRMLLRFWRILRSRVFICRCCWVKKSILSIFWKSCCV